MTRKLFIVALLLIAGVLIFINKGGDEAPYHSFHGNIFGTRYKVQYQAHKKLGLTPNQLKQQVENEFQRIDNIASSWKADSEISRFNRSAAKDDFRLSKELSEIIALSEEVKASTDGAFDIHYRGNEIDVSAIAKGYAVDRICDYLGEELHIDAFLVDIGGEIKAKGKNAKGKLWTVAIYIPPSHAHVKGPHVELSDTSIATSGQYFKPDHIKQAGHGISNDLLSSSVIHPSNATADALATALFVMGSEAGLAWAKEHKIRAIFIKTDGTVIETMGAKR